MWHEVQHTSVCSRLTKMIHHLSFSRYTQKYCLKQHKLTHSAAVKPIAKMTEAKQHKNKQSEPSTTDAVPKIVKIIGGIDFDSGDIVSIPSSTIKELTLSENERQETVDNEINEFEAKFVPTSQMHQSDDNDEFQMSFMQNIQVKVEAQTAVQSFDCDEVGIRLDEKEQVNSNSRTTIEQTFVWDQSEGSFASKSNRQVSNYQCFLIDENVIPKDEIEEKFCDTDSDEKPFSCDSSERKFDISLKKQQRKYFCDACGKFFDRHQHFRAHLLTHREKRFVCDICGWKFTLKSHVKTHMLTHTGEKPFSCEACGKKFTTKNSLKYHKVIHSGVKREKPFPCEICSTKFATKRQVKQHVKSTHRCEKRFSCDECEEKFAIPYYLKVHKRIHTGTKITFVITACCRL